MGRRGEEIVKIMAAFWFLYLNILGLSYLETLNTPKKQDHNSGNLSKIAKKGGLGLRLLR